MSRKKVIDPTLVDGISKDLFCVTPLLRKKLLHMDVIQNECGIPLSHVQVLSMLDEAGSMSVSEISQRLGIAKPNITPLVDRLIESHYVDRIRDAQDRRVVNIVILDEGREKLKCIHETVSNQVRSWAEALTAPEFRSLAESLGSLRHILEKLA